MGNTQDIYTIIGLVVGLVAGWIIGSNNIYSRMNKANLLINRHYDDPANQLDGSSRFILFLVGGLFIVIGIGILVARFAGLMGESEETGMVTVFAFICIGMGSLVLVPAIKGKSAS